MNIRTSVKRIASVFIKSKSVIMSDMVLTGPFQDYGVLNAIAKKRHEPMFQVLFSDVVKENMTVVDIGAHLGKYSLLAAQNVGKGGQVHSFEPHPRTFRFLEKNVKRNQLDSIVKVYNMAISNRDGMQKLNVDNLQSDFTSFAVVRDSRDVTQCDVKTATLDSVAPESYPHVYKIDVEGAELLVLKGVMDTLARSRAKGIRPVMFIEANSEALAAFGETPESLLACIKQVGFTDIKKIDENSMSLTENVMSEQTENWLCQ